MNARGYGICFADAKKAGKVPGWKPEITFNDLVRIMPGADLRAVGIKSPGEGDAICAKKWKKKWWKGN